MAVGNCAVLVLCILIGTIAAKNIEWNRKELLLEHGNLGHEISIRSAGAPNDKKPPASVIKDEDTEDMELGNRFGISNGKCASGFVWRGVGCFPSG